MISKTKQRDSFPVGQIHINVLALQFIIIILHRLDHFLLKTSKHLSLGRSLLIFLSFISLLVTSFHVFLGPRLGKLPLTLKILHLRNQALSSILSRSEKHYSLLSCRYSLIFFDFIQVLSSFTDILSSDLTLYIHPTILAPFLSSLIECSSLTGQVSFPYSTTLCTHVEYILLFAFKGKCTPSSSYSVIKITKLFRNFRDWLFNSMRGRSCVMPVC